MGYAKSQSDIRYKTPSSNNVGLAPAVGYQNRSIIWNLLLPVFFFLFIPSFVFAEQCGYFGTYLQDGVCVPDVLINTASIVMVVSLLIASLFFMFGIALQHNRIITWSKDLLFQLFGSAIILMVYLGIIAIYISWINQILM